MSYNLDGALELHGSAARAFTSDARNFAPDRWHEPLAPGKWTPAQVSDHLVKVYDVLIGEMNGGSGMRVRTRWWIRIPLRLFLVPRLLAGRPFPKGARAPSEVRPVESPDREVALELFARRAREFEEAARAAPPHRKITHAYFGSSSVVNGVMICARHIEHHRKQIAEVR